VARDLVLTESDNPFQSGSVDIWDGNNFVVACVCVYIFDKPSSNTDMHAFIKNKRIVFFFFCGVCVEVKIL
jgi:hypothetical protein